MKTLIVAITVGLSALAITGCKLTKVCVSTGGMEVQQAEGGVAQVRVDDDCFGEWLAVESSKLRRTGTGFLQAIVQIRNIKADRDDNGRRDDFMLQYRITWFDRDGAEILPDTSYWMSKKLIGGESVQFSAVAPNAGANSFVFRARHDR